jgi:opacity protein-like surface antigen
MPSSSTNTTGVRSLETQGHHDHVQGRSGSTIAVLLGLCAANFLIALPSSVRAQEWGGESDDSWSEPANSRSAQGGNGLPMGWSLRAGIGFVDDPSAFLLNFEAPYAFDQWISAGPMFQIGLDNHNTIVAPTVNVTVTIPDLPGQDFDRFHPYGFAGMGFAYIEDDNRRNNNSSAGFLVNFGFGLEYQVRDNFFLGSQMMFNFLPEEVLDEHFFYSWQIGGARIAF